MKIEIMEIGPVNWQKTCVVCGCGEFDDGKTFGFSSGFNRFDQKFYGKFSIHPNAIGSKRHLIKQSVMDALMKEPMENFS